VDDADGPRHRTVSFERGYSEFAANSATIGSLDGELDPFALISVIREEPFGCRTVVEKQGDVLAEQVLAVLPRQLDDAVVDRDEPTVSVELVDSVVDRVHERSIAPEDFGVVGVPPERRSRGPNPFTHTRNSVVDGLNIHMVGVLGTTNSVHIGGFPFNCRFPS
jgi:hypothetical protein